MMNKYNVMVFGSGHSAIYLTAIELWTEKPFIGSGIKSFRIKCKTKFIYPIEFASHILIIII